MGLEDVREAAGDFQFELCQWWTEQTPRISAESLGRSRLGPIPVTPRLSPMRLISLTGHAVTLFSSNSPVAGDHVEDLASLARPRPRAGPGGARPGRRTWARLLVIGDGQEAAGRAAPLSDLADAAPASGSHPSEPCLAARVPMRGHEPEGMSSSGPAPRPVSLQAGGSLLFAAPGTPAGNEH